MTNFTFKLVFFSLLTLFLSKTSGFSCPAGERSPCSNRGYCSSDDTTCICDDYLHYWPSEHCSTQHDGRELPAGMFCYPNTIDQYCSWIGTCSADGSQCICPDPPHRSSEERCAIYHAEPVTPPPDGAACYPGDQSYCSYLGVCNTEGSGCECYDILHYWPSEQCSTWHSGRELPVGMCCSPGVMDQYCNWMGTCSADGLTCECTDSEHRSSVSRCLDWVPDSSTVTYAPTISPPFSSLHLSPRVGNQTCLYVEIIDNFGDGWDNNVFLLYETINSTIGSTSVIKGVNGYKIEGCLPKLSHSHPIRLSISSESSSRFLWEIQWSIQILSAAGNSDKYYGGYDALFDFNYDLSSDTYLLTLWDNRWVYPEESESCANLPGSIGCNNFNIQFSAPSSLTHSSNHTGGDYHEASWVITNTTSLDVINFGIPWGTAIIDNSIGHICTSCLTNGNYILRVSGANYSPQKDIKWTFCGVSGGASNQLSFTILNGVCTPTLPIVKLQALVFQDVCSPVPINPTVSPTKSPTSSSSPTIASTPSPSIATLAPVSPYIPTPPLTSTPVIQAIAYDNGNAGSIILKVDVTVTTLGGTIYCASFPSTYSLTDVTAIVAQNHWTAAPEAANYPSGTLTSTVEVIFSSLNLYSSYSFYCVASDSSNIPSTTITDAIDTSAANIYIYYPITSTIYSTANGFALSDQNQYNTLTPTQLQSSTVSFTLDHPPLDSVSVSLIFVDTTTNTVVSDVIYSPSNYIITNTAIGDGLKGSFLVYGLPGTYTVSLQFTGLSAASFLPSNIVGLTILSDITPLPLIMPKISTALFDYSGARIIVTFDATTDYAATVVHTNTWNCNKIFIFDGVNEASCVWINSMSVAITLNYYGRSSIIVSPGQQITLLNDVLKSTASTSIFASSSTAIISVVGTHVLPSPVLIGPNKIVNCKNLIIDPSLSIGQGGRNWQNIKWKVTAADGSDTTSILNLLNTITSTTSPITITSTLLRTTTYTISLGLKNFLQSSSEQFSYTTITVEVISGSAVVTLTLSSPSVINVEKSSILIIDAHADLTYCHDTSTNMPLSPTASFIWQVKKNNVVDTSIISIAPNPSSFVVHGNQFDLESAYEISVIVTYDSTWSNSKSITVFGVESNVKALISGGMSSVAIQSSESFVVDALSSVGTNLVYQWSCRIVSTTNYGSDYFKQIGFTPSNVGTLTFPSFTFAAGARYLITLVVTSTSLTGTISDSTSLTLYVPTSIADVSILLEYPIPSSPFNTQNTLQILTQLQSPSSSNVHATWSVVSPSTLQLSYPITALVPLSNDFTPTQLTTGIIYPFGIKPNTLASGTTYTFRLSASQTGVSDRFMDISIISASPPFGGDISISPTLGNEYDTIFTLSGTYWVSDPHNYPLLYQFVYQVASNFDWSDSYSLINSLQRAPYASTLLPAGDTSSSNTLVIAVIVMDIWGAEGHASQTITVSPNTHRKLLTENTFDSSMNSFAVANAAHQLDGMISSFQMAVNIVNDVVRPDCSLAQNCQILHRESCSTVSQTCGPCLENFIGIYGDSNSPCHPSSESRSSIGEICLTDADCEYEYCNTVEKVCAYPIQSCPIGTNGNICSGHGTCSYITLQGDTIDECTVDNINCLSTCTCDSQFGGHDCSLSDTDLSTMKLHRGALCDALDILTSKFTFIKDQLQTQVNYLLQIYDPSSTPLNECGSTITTLSNLIQSTTPSIGVQTNIAKVISSYANSTTEILNLVLTFQSSIYNGMIPGQAAISFSTLNYRVLFTYDSLTNLHGGVTLSAPLTDTEIIYHKSAVNITLPESGLIICDEFVNYAKLILTVWGQSPYIIPSDLVQGNLFITSTYSTKTSSTSASTSITTTEDSTHYDLNLYLNEDIKIDTYVPICLEYDFTLSTFSPCTHCDVTSYSSHLANIGCNDASSYFCPSSSSKTSATSIISSDTTSIPKMYTLGISLITDPYHASKKQNEMNTGVLSFVSVFALCFLIGLITFFWWDRVDRNKFIDTADIERTQRQKITYLLSAAFDKSGHKSNLGVKLSQIAAASTPRGPSVHHDHSSFNRERPLFALNNPLNGTTTNARNDGNGRPIPEILAQNSTPSSTIDLDVISERNTLSSTTTPNISVEQENTSIMTWSDFPISSLLSEHSWFSNIFYAIGRYHKWIRIFTYPSMRKSRLIRFIVAATDLLFIIFTNTIFYMIFYPDDGTCQSHSNTSMEQCLSENSKFESTTSMCQWHNDGLCTLRDPPFTLKFVVEVCMIVIVFSSIPRSIFQYIIEKICAKRPMVEKIGLNPATVLFSEPIPANSGYKVRNTIDLRNNVLGRAALEVDVATDTYALTHCDHMNIIEEGETILHERPLLETNPNNGNNYTAEYNQILSVQRNLLHLDESGSLKPLTWRQWVLFRSTTNHFQWKIRRAREEANYLVKKLTDGTETSLEQTDYADMCLLQHFIFEQVSPITRFALKKDIFEMDNASPGRISFLAWLSAWIGVIAVWIFMISWVLSWSVNNGAGPARAWGLVLAIVVIADMITNELSQIYFLHVHMISKLRPQLREIFTILSDILENRLKYKSPRYGGLRVPQHFSPACRAARSQSLSGHLSSHILSLVDDIDVQLCRQSRLVDLRDVGLFSWMTLFHPALLNTVHDIFQQTVMDLIVPIAWCCFILLNSAILQFSVYLLIALYVGGLLLMLWFYFFIANPQNQNTKPYHQITVAGRRKSLKDSSELELINHQPYTNTLHQPLAPYAGDVLLGSEVEDNNRGGWANENYLAVPISDGTTTTSVANPEGVELYFNSDIFSGQQQMIASHENEYTL